MLVRLRILPLAAILAAHGLVAEAKAQIRVVTSTPNLRDLVQQVGGAHVEAQSIMRGPENAHNVVAKPSSMMAVRRADLFVHMGLDGEPWVPLLLKGARRPHLLIGGDGNVDASRGVALRDVPGRGELSRAQGDIHAFGNPHYLLDPVNAAVVARHLAGALAQRDPEHRGDYEANLAAFERRLDELAAKLDARLRPYRGAAVATYHRAWPYFLDRFGLVKVAEVEPKPGISPWPAHLEQCIETMTSRGAKVVIVETFSHRENAEFVAQRAGGVAVVLGLEVGSIDGVATYAELLEQNAERLVAAFQKAGVEPAPAAESPTGKD